MLIHGIEEYVEYAREISLNKVKAALEGGDWEALAEMDEAFHKEGARFLEEEGFLPGEYLFQLFQCSPFQRHCVLMALSYEGDEAISGGFSALRQAGYGEGFTPYIAEKTWPFKLTDWELRQTFHPGSILMRVFFQKAAESYPEKGKPLRLNRRVSDFIFGMLEEEETLKPFMVRCRPEAPEPLGKNQPDVAALLGEEASVVELTGPAGAGKHFCARNFCSRMGRMIYFIGMDRLLQAGEQGWERLEEIWRECRLFQAIPVFVQGEETLTASEAFPLMEYLLEEGDLVWILNEKPLPHEKWKGKGKWLHFDVGDMNLTEKRQVWKKEAEVYSVEKDVCVEEMANLFPLTYGGIRTALENAAWQAKCHGRESICREDLQRGCYSLFPVNLRDKAVPVPAVYKWDDLILPEYQRGLLSAACNQVRYRHQVYEGWGFSDKIPYGRGVSMIFAGPPGTGKTMAAQVFAGELGIDLYKIELSAVVSKFVGETEKNLNEIFEQAKKSRIILLFDEADVLFGKRTEVKEANDKYSNMEAAFLLQKMEEYEGVTILATNLIQNFDEAFKRRVKFVIDFPFPGPKERGRIWRKTMPQEMEREELDLDYLAERFELSGSNIKNVILHGAFLAAAEKIPVNMRHLLLGIRNEYAKSGKTLTKRDVGEYYVLLPELQS